LLKIVRAKVNYVPKDFLPDIVGICWLGLIAPGSSDANSNAHAEEIIFFCYEASRESFGYAGQDRRRGWP